MLKYYSTCRNYRVNSPKMKMLSFTHPHVVPNLKDLCSSLEHK